MESPLQEDGSDIERTGGGSSFGIRGFVRTSGVSKMKRAHAEVVTEMRNLNWWQVAERSFVIFVGATAFFAFANLGYAVYFFDPWIGAATTAAAYVISFALMALALTRGTQPIFDYPPLIANLVHIGMSSYTDEDEVVKNTRTSEFEVKARIGGEFHWIEALIYFVVLFAATVTGAGLARAMAGDNLYAHVAKTIPHESTAVRAFVLEWAVQSLQMITVQQMGFHYSKLPYIGLINGLATLGFQILGHGISRSCYNTMYWLGLSIIGSDIKFRGEHHDIPVVWWNADSWVWPVSTIVALLTTIVFGFIFGLIKKNRVAYAHKQHHGDTHSR